MDSEPPLELMMLEEEATLVLVGMVLKLVGVEEVGAPVVVRISWELVEVMAIVGIKPAPGALKTWAVSIWEEKIRVVAIWAIP